VSTEKQKKKGESFDTQKTQITQFVEMLDKTIQGGTVIPEHCWQYCGQEHATPDHERALLDKLLADSGKNLFDAVICCDATRWSRDNLKSKTGLEILRKNRIRFFIGTMEYDLFKPEHILFLGMSAEIGEYHARSQSEKSNANRIARAERGIPTSGKLPYGRAFNKKTLKWEPNDEEEAKRIKEEAGKIELAARLRLERKKS
jgi:DNA invertase Pin-like site-specific DNA recombinase